MTDKSSQDQPVCEYSDSLDDLDQPGVNAACHLVPAILSNDPVGTVGKFHKYFTTNACLSPWPVRQTLFSTLVDYTSSITRRSD